tara:strand:+ start:938 stop:1180 length:243 start_codon:yes stop_codon:yes gene_type:complete
MSYYLPIQKEYISRIYKILEKYKEDNSLALIEDEYVNCIDFVNIHFAGILFCKGQVDDNDILELIEKFFSSDINTHRTIQ